MLVRTLGTKLLDPTCHCLNKFHWLVAAVTVVIISIWAPFWCMKVRFERQYETDLRTRLLSYVPVLSDREDCSLATKLSCGCLEDRLWSTDSMQHSGTRQMISITW